MKSGPVASYYIIGLSILFMLSCTRDGVVDDILGKYDMLLSENPAEAWALLENMDTRSFSKEENAYYNLIATIARHKNRIPFQSDSAIDSSRQWYAKSRNRHNYIRALFYDGLVIRSLRPGDTLAFHYMKEAGNLLDESGIDDAKLEALIQVYLGPIHASESNNQAAIDHYLRACEIEKRLGNRTNLVYDYCYLINAYVAAHESEKAGNVILKLDSLVSVTPGADSSTVCNTKAIYFCHKQEPNLDSALHYALLQRPVPADRVKRYQLLATIYQKLDNLDSALVYEQKAFANRNASDSLYHYIYLNKLAEIYSRLGESDSTAYYAQLAYQSLYDNYERKTARRILELEKLYDTAAQKDQLRRVNASRTIVSLIALVCLLAASFLSYVFVQHRKRLKEAEDRTALAECLMEAQQAANQEQEIRLQQERLTKNIVLAAAKTHQNTLSTLEEFKSRPLIHPEKTLPQRIAQLTTNLRSGFSTHFAEAIEGTLDLLNPEQRIVLKRLSGARTKTVWLLKEFGYTVEEIAIYTCTSPDSVRATLSKINKTLSDQNNDLL